MTEPRRPALRYHGGKWRLAPWIIGHFPPHRIYVEPYGGGASVLLRKPPSWAEVYNDLDQEIVSLFRVLRDAEQCGQLVRQLELTPWSRVEFDASYEETDDPIERARRMVVRAYMAFGTTNLRRNRTGFRAKGYRQNQTGVRDFIGVPANLRRVAERLRLVCIENRDAIEVIGQQDGPDTLFYVDPPYVQSTRSSLAGRTSSANERAYRHDMSDEQHRQLASALRAGAGMVVLSGYHCPLYDELYGDWPRFQKQAFADMGVTRTEVLWISPRTAASLPTLFTMAEA